MTKFKTLILIAALINLTCAIDPIEKHKTTVPPSSTSTSTLPPTTPTSPLPPSPNVTTTAIPPTTSSTSTTPQPTTPPPINTTTKLPPTTPAPQPSTTLPPHVNPSTGRWSQNYTNTNNSCIILQAAIEIDVNYNTTDNKTATAKINVPPSATINGNCGILPQAIALTWDMNTITFNFRNTSTRYELSSILIGITPDNTTFPGKNGSEIINLQHDKAEFNTSVSKSYKCAKEVSYNLTFPASNVTVGYLRFSNLQLEAFHGNTTSGFADAIDCAPFDTPDIVPIAAGCTLIVLIVLILLAYLIGRRRAQARGYLSM